MQRPAVGNCSTFPAGPPEWAAHPKRALAAPAKHNSRVPSTRLQPDERHRATSRTSRKSALAGPPRSLWKASRRGSDGGNKGGNQTFLRLTAPSRTPTYPLAHALARDPGVCLVRWCSSFFVMCRKRSRPRPPHRAGGGFASARQRVSTSLKSGAQLSRRATSMVRKFSDTLNFSITRSIASSPVRAKTRPTRAAGGLVSL